MKVMFPQHIKKGFFSWVSFSIMWFSINLIQLFVLAIWVILALAAFSTCNNQWAKTLWVTLAIIIFLIFCIIAFFNVSELNLIAFTAKKIKDLFLDEPKKYQNNYVRNNPTEILIAKSKQEKGKQRIEIKWEMDFDKLSNIDKWWIL